MHKQHVCTEMHRLTYVNVCRLHKIRGGSLRLSPEGPICFIFVKQIDYIDLSTVLIFHLLSFDPVNFLCRINVITLFCQIGKRNSTLSILVFRITFVGITRSAGTSNYLAKAATRLGLLFLPNHLLAPMPS